MHRVRWNGVVILMLWDCLFVVFLCCCGRGWLLGTRIKDWSGSRIPGVGVEMWEGLR